MIYLKYNQTTGEIEGQVGWSNSNDPDVIQVDDAIFNSFISPKVNLEFLNLIEGAIRSDLESQAIQKAKDYRDQLWNSGSPSYNGKSYYYSDNLKGVIQAINSSDATSIPDPRSWQADDGSIVLLSHSDFMAIGVAEIARRDAVFQRYVTIVSELIPSTSQTAWTDKQVSQFINDSSSMW